MNVLKIFHVCVKRWCDSMFRYLLLWIGFLYTWCRCCHFFFDLLTRQGMVNIFSVSVFYCKLYVKVSLKNFASPYDQMKNISSINEVIHLVLGFRQSTCDIVSPNISIDRGLDMISFKDMSRYISFQTLPQIHIFFLWRWYI